MFEELQPRHTKIATVIEISSGRAILEEHARFPLGESNLYFLTKNDEPVWDAERPAANVHYIRVRLNEDGRTLSAYTTGRHACEIDIKSGKLISQLEFR